MITVDLFADGTLHCLTEDGRGEPPPRADIDCHPYGRHALPEVHGSYVADVYRIFQKLTNRSFPVGGDDYVGRHRVAEVA